MWKKIIAITAHILVFVILIVSVGTISLSSTATEGEVKFNGNIEKNVTLRILENDTAKSQGYLQELLEAFNKEYEQFGIVAIDANQDQYTNLEDDGPYGYGPDVLYQANDVLMKYVDGKHILPLPVNTLDCFEQISQKAWDAFTTKVDGEDVVCAVPVNVQGPLLYYRKDLLPSDWRTNWDKDKNDVPDMVESWSEMYRYSKLVKKESGGKKYGYMKSLIDSYFSTGYLLSYGGYVFGSGGKDTKDVGFSNGDAYKGAKIVRQLASLMNEECIDFTITNNSYSKMAEGTYFATMTTPDVYTLFIKEMKIKYEEQGVSSIDAEALAKANLVVTNVPKLPKNGDLEKVDDELMESKMMGGINGYGISAYTKAPNACLEFVNFATKYEMIKCRQDLLGIVPARRDNALEVGGLAEIIFENLDNGNIAVMPSVRAVAQIWTPTETFYSDIAKDPFRKPQEMRYTSDQAIIDGLKKVDKQIYDAIHTLN
ncbi:MAG: extracellular solute-binding protein [Clostridia bacterium]